jgi:hypothetical protein
MIPKSRDLTSKLALIAGILLLIGYAGYEWRGKDNESSPPPPPIHPRVPQSKFTAKGMTYINAYKGKLLIVMKVSSLEFGKKKMGFFRVGGARQLELRDAEIDYHEPLLEGSGDVGSTEDPRDISRVVMTAAQSFTDWKGRLAGLQIRRLRLHYHHADGTQTDIEGDLLEIERSDKSLRIRGNAVVRHSGRSLSSHEIFFEPQDKTFFTKKSYALDANGKSQRGNEIRTDLFLKPLPEKTKRENRDEANIVSTGDHGKAK